MNKEEIVKKNLDLQAEFMRYSFEHPDILDKMPKGAQLVILPEDDPELYEENSKIVRSHREKGIPVIIAKMKTPRPVTPTLESIVP